MRRVSLLLLCASLALAADPPFFNLQLTVDASRRYLVYGQMGSTQNFNFALTTGTPYLTVAGVGCTDCSNVPAYNPQTSTTYQPLAAQASVNLTGGSLTSGTLFRDNCVLHAKDGNSWNYPNQTILMSNNQSSAYAGQASGLFGLAYGRGTNNTDVSVIGGVFGRKPTAPHVQYGLALLPPNAKNSTNAGSLHWLGNDTNAYDGDITWKTTTITSNSAYTYFEIDGWQLKIGSTTVSNANQDLASAIDLYHPNMFFPSSEAQLIHAAIQGSSPKQSADGQSTIYTIPCNSKFSLATIIGGKSWQVDQTLLVEKQDDGTCVSNIQGWTDTNDKQYIFGSTFLSSLYVIVQVANPNSGQSDQIGFAKRANPPSIVGPIVGGVVGGVAGIAIISLAIFFWIRRRDQQKLKDILDAEDRGGNVGRFVENKDIQPFPFTQPASVPPTSPTVLSYASTAQPPITPGFVEGIPRSPDVNDPLLPPSYDQTYPAGPSNPSQQQQPNPFPGHARKQ